MIKAWTLLLLVLSVSVSAQSTMIEDFNYVLNDLTALNLSKNKLFSEMNRTIVKSNSSICSNRAHVWGWDFKRNYNLDTGKIFLFYTKRDEDRNNKTWWYHVAPIVNEKTQLWVMDAGFSFITTPLLPKDWLKAFTGSTNCKEIKAHETDLVKHIFKSQTFPKKTQYGTFDCYYKIAPAGYWTPSMIPKGLLGIDENGQPIRFQRDEILIDEVFQACVEVATSPVGRLLRTGHKACRRYLNLTELDIQAQL